MTTCRTEDVWVEAIQYDIVEIETGQIIRVGAEPYEGEYEVTPKAYTPTVLPTEGKTMEENVTVKEVPYRKVANPNGGYTVIIAKEVEN